MLAHQAAVASNVGVVSKLVKALPVAGRRGQWGEHVRNIVRCFLDRPYSVDMLTEPKYWANFRLIGGELVELVGEDEFVLLYNVYEPAVTIHMVELLHKKFVPPEALERPDPLTGHYRPTGHWRVVLLGGADHYGIVAPRGSVHARGILTKQQADANCHALDSGNRNLESHPRV